MIQAVEGIIVIQQGHFRYLGLKSHRVDNINLDIVVIEHIQHNFIVTQNRAGIDLHGDAAIAGFFNGVLENLESTHRAFVVDGADLDGHRFTARGPCVGASIIAFAGAGRHGKYHGKSCDKSKKLLHVLFHSELPFLLQQFILRFYALL